jgi:hypothetical protein
MDRKNENSRKGKAYYRYLRSEGLDDDEARSVVFEESDTNTDEWAGGW